ncbi:MAG: outer membrane lipoprotein LolB [Thiotrichales bacterium]|jgi:outer membrane lipoprotein LolB|nr:outer membrane lipoprotein LolB [Thiotrichales bacterium]MBT3613313.1 outer membrane lipoprotein LolB [Thiotrichales bacterium]MBT3752428.1 outer membrane lipoprotein LolB [Thiotrichales bacterium]MBT3836984.1 outer membrane lipoprotein LolB [Thiotrichales bacterium]MBT4152741.1 outer membrane lipoprotein LolB [Thiotrichales bacterium]
MYKIIYVLSIYVAALSSLLLTGCTALPPHSLEYNTKLVSWEERREKLSMVQQWSVEGRAAFQIKVKEFGSAESGRETRGGQSGFRWSQLISAGEKRQKFNLTGLLGAGALQLESTPTEAILIDSDGNAHLGEDPEQLLYEVSGWRFPLSEAVEWVKGIPATGVAVESLKLDSQNRVKELAQSGWVLNIKRYQTVNGVDLPALLTIKRKDVKVTLRISRWLI